MGKKQKLTHEEIWDDTALINSWDEALEEYQRYHSLHARGEKVKEILRNGDEMPNDKAKGMTKRKALLNGISHDDLEPQDLDNYDVGSESALVDAEKEEDILPAGKASSAHSVLHALTASVHDENLKNLMMSWYYAGYYTGFYEGQKQAPKIPGST